MVTAQLTLSRINNQRYKTLISHSVDRITELYCVCVCVCSVRKPNSKFVTRCRPARPDTRSPVEVYIGRSESSVSPAAQPRQRRHRNVALIDNCFYSEMSTAPIYNHQAKHLGHPQRIHQTRYRHLHSIFSIRKKYGVYHCNMCTRNQRLG